MRFETSLKTMTKSKSDREWHTFRQIFHSKTYLDVVKSEKPDFIVNHNGAKFGVEVTEYYQDQTSGNYANIPGYMDNILACELKIMKKDKGKLRKVQVDFEVNGSSVYSQNMMFREFLSPHDRLKRLEDVINSKAQAIEGYDVKKLKYVDLIVHDQGDLFGGEGGREIWRRLTRLSVEPKTNLPYRHIYICKKFGSFDEPIIFRS